MPLKKLIVPSLLAIGMATSLTACGEKTKTQTKATTKTAQIQKAGKPVLGDFGIALDNMDKTVKPGDNFFKYVNGTWLKNTEIPADKSAYGAFGALADQSEARVKSIIEDLSKQKNKPGSVEQKIGDLFSAYMDTKTIEQKGLAPLKEDLAVIDGVKNHSDIASLMGDPVLGLESPFGTYIWTDAKDPTQYILYVYQSGLGMPNRDYYIEKDEKSVETRKAYLSYLTKMLEAAGRENASAKAKAILAFETELAKVQWPPEKARNRDLTYHKKTLAELEKFAPGIDWNAAFSKAGIADKGPYVLNEDTAIQSMAKIFANTPVATLKDYMAAHYVGSLSSYLPKDIDQASFDFYGKTLRGTEQQRDRWKRGVSVVNANLGEAVGKVWVKRYFPPEAKQQMDILVQNLRGAFKDKIANLDWMSAETKVEAQDKLKKFYPKIGYPKKWKDYSTMQVNKEDLIGTIKSARLWQWKDELKKLGGPIDKEEWGMMPQTVNAYYNPGFNEIVFPAAILQPPFFDPNADPAVNYGGIGAVIGHEMGHGFDDQGAKSDGDGKKRNWWTEADKKAFEAKTKALVNQYNQFEALPGLHVNGERTLGENIGDLTGLTMAYTAYKKSLNGKEAPVIDGLTGDQRFFLSYGQVWQRKFRDEALRTRIKTDPHSPGEFRANGIVRNFDAWYDAFDVKPGDKLYLPPEKRVRIW